MVTVYAKNIVSSNNVEAFLALAKELVEKTNQEDGCHYYELVRSIDQVNVFAFMEKWENRAALDAHMKTEHFTRIVPQLGKLTEGDSQVAIHDVIF